MIHQNLNRLSQQTKLGEQDYAIELSPSELKEKLKNKIDRKENEKKIQ